MTYNENPYIRPEDILTNSYLRELKYNGFTTDEQIENHMKEDLIIKGIIIE